jgi:DNA-binding transcriptional MerR regulator/methylmalonyl-CoA mutase cobalamin-binding subunit
MFSIGVVARQTGIEIGTLRKWEDRYGFPQPLRRDSGQRLYQDSDIEKLLRIARRVATGERVGKIIRELHQQTTTTQAQHADFSGDSGVDAIETALSALLKHDVPGLKRALDDALMLRSTVEFVEKIAAPLTRLVGEYWAQGKLPIHGEHLFSSVMETLLLRQASLSPGANVQPAVILTSPAGEQHTLGLSMANAVLAEAGIGSLMLPGGLPLPEIVAPTTAYRVRVVGISASCHYPPRMLHSMIAELRAALPDGIAVWFGGAGMNRVCNIPAGVTVISSLYQLGDAVKSLGLSGDQFRQPVKVP